MALIIPSFSFCPGVSDKLGYFVYALVDPGRGKPFYVGKGKGDRPYAHGKTSGTGRREETAKAQRIKKIRRAGREPSVVVICYALTEEIACFVESVVIEVLRRSGVELTNMVGGQNCAQLWRYEDEVNAALGAKRRLLADPCILVRIKKSYRPDMSSKELMRITCGAWKFKDPRSDRSDASRAKFILGVKDGVVRTAYEINHKTWRRSGPRWRCKGVPCEELKNIDVRGQFRDQARFQYLNCSR
jgi:hypothetical protein